MRPKYWTSQTGWTRLVPAWSSTWGLTIATWRRVVKKTGRPVRVRGRLVKARGRPVEAPGPGPPPTGRVPPAWGHLPRALKSGWAWLTGANRPKDMPPWVFLAQVLWALGLLALFLAFI